ncbi:hypothetical protein D3C72_955350 [compost metagenome]
MRRSGRQVPRSRTPTGSASGRTWSRPASIGPCSAKASGHCRRKTCALPAPSTSRHASSARRRSTPCWAWRMSRWPRAIQPPPSGNSCRFGAWRRITKVPCAAWCVCTRRNRPTRRGRTSTACRLGSKRSSPACAAAWNSHACASKVTRPCSVRTGRRPARRWARPRPWPPMSPGWSTSWPAACATWGAPPKPTRHSPASCSASRATHLPAMPMACSWSPATAMRWPWTAWARCRRGPGTLTCMHWSSVSAAA